MKKIVLSSVLAIALSGAIASAGTIKFYTDSNGQVFVTPGKGRTELNVNPQEVLDAMQSASEVKLSSKIKEDTIKEEIKKEIKAELKDELKKDTPVFAKASKLKFSGKHYLGYTHRNYKDFRDSNGVLHHKSDNGKFEARRNYVQLKAYLLQDPKSYFRVTLDSVTTAKSQGSYADETHGYANVYIKYAYLYLNEVLPYTGVEFGQVHRPWIDYEEHQGWWMRSLSKVFVEASETAHLTNSADLGVNFKTKTDYFTSEVGLFNGEGYHGKGGNESSIGSGNSLEWRFTASIMGNGKKKRKPKKDTYFDTSFFGQYNVNNSKNEVKDLNGQEKAYDYTIMGAHTVFNMPSFLISAQYVQSKNDGTKVGDGTSQYNGDGYSVNGTFRFGEKKQFSVIGRYDVWKAQNEALQAQNKLYRFRTTNAIYGLTWEQNKNLKWLLSSQSYKAKDHKNYKGSDANDWMSAMLTAEVHW